MNREPATGEPAAGVHHDAEDVLRRLGEIELLRALPPEEVQELAPRVEYLEFPAGHRLMEQDAEGDALYLIEKGTARVERRETPEIVKVPAGSVVGEGALLRGGARSATVIADTDLAVWRIGRDDFHEQLATSPRMKAAFERLVDDRRRGVVSRTPSRAAWIATAMRALEARNRSLTLWEALFAAGMILWVALQLNEWRPFLRHEALLAAVQLVTGLLIIQGACEAFVHACERLGARLRWDGFISGTVGSVLSTLPEFVVIAFLVRVDPLAAFVTAAVTIFNNALAFSVYSFFLPKNRAGAYAMPRSLTVAGGEILIAGGATTLIVGSMMLIMRIDGTKSALAGTDLVVIGAILIAIYAYYLMTLVRYYGEGMDDVESQPPDPARLGHATSWPAIVSMFALGIAGAYCGGQVIGAFADTALRQLGWPTIPTAAALAFFAGISEYIIVYKSHRRGELGLALSNVFGGMTQVMFLLLPFGLVVIGVSGLVTGEQKFMVPINVVTMMLMLLLFPLFYALHQYIEQDKTLSNLDAAGMTGIYLLLLYFLLTSPG